MKQSDEVQTAGGEKNIMFTGEADSKPCDLATTVNFLVTCVQHEMLHISHHYEWIHLPPEYLTVPQIRLQNTGELLIPVDNVN